MVNQSTNGNDYGQATAKKESRKTSIKNNIDEGKPVLPQEVARSPIGFSKISQEEASHKQDNNNIQKFQPFPPNMINFDPRLIMQNKDITQQNLQNSRIEIRKSEQDLSKELIQDPKEESDTYLPEDNDLFHIPSANEDSIFPEYSIKQEMTAEKESDITKTEYPIKPKPKNSTNIRNHVEQDLMENKSDPNEIYRSNSINHSTNAKEEDSPATYHNSNKENNNFNLGINYFSFDKTKESQINKKEKN
ncbi:hypothetical protein O181_096876 [Austropuccinia psidii MF-1]|uniref:Uncharacterized protein n=1 Tax=Austropuccinia psidii MF-1 TaxID=1389203 RepID=A0A9Q3J8A0_9BASI|nr:hypothetical protein [Austropuccinia psidii MF-1]